MTATSESVPVEWTRSCPPQAMITVMTLAKVNDELKIQSISRSNHPDPVQSRHNADDGSCVAADVHFPAGFYLLDKVRGLAAILIDLLCFQIRDSLSHKPRSRRKHKATV